MIRIIDNKQCDKILLFPRAASEKRPVAILPGNDMRGGVFYRGCNNPELNGNYIFGNFING